MSDVKNTDTSMTGTLFMDSDVITLACAFSAFENVTDEVVTKYISNNKFNFTDADGNPINKIEMLVLNSGCNEVYFVFECEDKENPILQILTIVLDQDPNTGEARQKIFDIRALTNEQYWLFSNIAGRSLIDKIFKLADEKFTSVENAE